MKKLLVATLAFSLILGAANVFAQEETGLTGKGIKVGLNLANLTGSDAPDDLSMKLGFVGGGFITYQFNELFAIQPELLFTMKGAKSDVAGVDVKYNTNYIEIPILFKVLLAGGGNFKPNFYAGPEVSFLMSAKNTADPEPPGWVEDVKDETKSTDFGLIGGVGADFLMGETGSKITFDIRYDIGLTSIDDSGADNKIMNSVISFLVGYGF